MFLAYTINTYVIFFFNFISINYVIKTQHDQFFCGRASLHDESD
jgi:hypothetical protein